MLEKRLKSLNNLPPKEGPVVYWMSRDQRVHDNWGLVYAQSEAVAMKQPLFVVFALVESYLCAQDKHYAFMGKGLLDVLHELQKNRVCFHVLIGNPVDTIPNFLEEIQAGLLITDFHVLRENREWKEKVAKNISCSFQEVDAHNVVPVWVASAKAEYGAYTLRPKIKRLLDDFLIDMPGLEPQEFLYDPYQQKVRAWYLQTKNLLEKMSKGCVRESGTSAACKVLQEFIDFKLPEYHLRNDPNRRTTSGLSPHIHFGQISTQRIAFEIVKTDHPNKDQFLEELIVRRELADNYCYYNPKYDSLEGAPEWARKTLGEHQTDPRPYLYSEDDLDSAVTHDPLWNAAQMEMKHSGTMPGYLRMYWAKKILEWSENAEEAYATAIKLNNKYFFDGRDPNGYAGIAWSIGGVHDRAWQEREIFGKVRFMSLAGARRKFDVDKYILDVESLTGRAISRD